MTIHDEIRALKQRVAEAHSVVEALELELDRLREAARPALLRTPMPPVENP